MNDSWDDENYDNDNAPFIFQQDYFTNGPTWGVIVGLLIVLAP